MKKSIKSVIYSALVGLCIFVSVDGYSQQQETSAETTLTPKFGIKGGVNLSNLYVDNVEDENMKVGFTGGFYAKLPMTRGISIQPELLYSNLGARLTYDNFIQGSGEYRFNLNYIQLPVSLVFNIVKNFNIHAGGYASYLTSANVKNVQNGDIQGVTDLDSDDFNRFDYGLVGGLGLDIENFTIGARYNYGLNQIGKSGNLSGDLTQDSKNSALTLFIGLAF
ncbi:MAG: PorT family protein [Cyclobacteriaceae bacterium]|nr:PorT family protein [Cyclobacteriaceae bacterium]